MFRRNVCAEAGPQGDRGTAGRVEEAVAAVVTQKVTQADSQTIINAIRTWKELAHYQEDRGLEVVEDLDLASFVQDGTDGPARARLL